MTSPCSSIWPVTCIGWSKCRPRQKGATPTGWEWAAMIPSKVRSASKAPSSRRRTRYLCSGSSIWMWLPFGSTMSRRSIESLSISGSPCWLT